MFMLANFDRLYTNREKKRKNTKSSEKRIFKKYIQDCFRACVLIIITNLMLRTASKTHLNQQKSCNLLPQP